jgi:aquaporin Z
MNKDIVRRITAEFLGTFWLTFGGCGAAVLAAGFPSLGIGFVGVSLAFGLTVLTMAYAVGHISGALQSGGHGRPVVGRTLRKPACPTLHHRPGDRRCCSGRDAVDHRFRQGELGC